MRTFEGGRIADLAIDGSHAGPDPHDAHVHAAAVACQAAYLLTANFRDFPGGSDDLLYEVIDPDSFFVLIDEASPGRVRSLTRLQMKYWVDKRSEAKLPECLMGAGCPKFAERVRAHPRVIGGIPHRHALTATRDLRHRR